jgi:hypothetical protein
MVLGGRIQTDYIVSAAYLLGWVKSERLCALYGITPGLSARPSGVRRLVDVGYAYTTEI